MEKPIGCPGQFSGYDWEYLGDFGDDLISVDYYFNHRNGQVGIHSENGSVLVYSREDWSAQHPNSPLNTVPLMPLGPEVECAFCGAPFCLEHDGQANVCDECRANGSF